MAEKNSGRHAGHRERMRKKFLKYGFDGFAEHEILEMLLYYSIPRKNTNELSYELLDKYHSLANVFEATPEGLMSIAGISEVTATLLTMVPQLSKAYEKSKRKSKVCLDSTEALGEYAVWLFKDSVKYEELALICLDANRRVYWSGIVIHGTLDSVEAYPRVVAEAALNQKASKIVLAHNHPGGTLAPSLADKTATEALVKALKGIEIEVLDHIIVSGARYFSMKEMGFKF